MSKNEKRTAERKKCGHNRGSDAFISSDGDDSRKGHPLTAGYNATGHQLSGNLKEKRTGETAGGNSGHGPTERDGIFNFRRNDLETQHRSKRVRQQRNENQRSVQRQIAHGYRQQLRRHHKASPLAQRPRLSNAIEVVALRNCLRRRTGAGRPSEPALDFFGRPSFTPLGQWS